MSRISVPPSEAGFNRPARSASSSAMSDARSEPTSLQQLFRHDAALSGTRPPPPSYPPLPQQVEGCKGVWSLNDDEIYGCDYPPVQTYLKQVRKAKRLVDPPSDVIWTLAALDVLYYPNDVAHWLFWSNDVYERHAKAVDAVALHKPRLIKSRVPWTGRLEYQSTVSQIQEKHVYVHINHKWYPTEPKHDRKQRTTRSSGEQALISGKEFFGLDVGCTCIVCTGSRKDNPEKKQVASKAPPKKKPLKSPSRVPRKAPTPASVPDDDSIDLGTAAHQGTPALALPEPLMKSKSHSPSPIRILSTGSSPRKVVGAGQLSPPLPSSSSSASSTSSHTRSTSQSSAETLVGNGSRSSSVESSETVVGASQSKKRKASDMEKDTDSLASEPVTVDRMVTRGRASKRRAVDPGESRLSSPVPTIAVEAPPSPAKTKPRAKRARA
ncbi:hypothetical protein CVT26_000299 [Gymnopilus dilepis]|uniref:Uncharacterized protein n=1 Tax=Gymnopilus dilepis TaxID=231916 RepID=A0A409VHD2_9AGAR|nr:hypothetical protein CVT26_000299 [Gymnopilus dilepis]